MKSPIFEISITENYYALLLSDKIIKPFLDKNQKRVKVIARFEDKEISFYGAIQKRGDHHYMMFGKRYQKELGVFPNDYFQIQFFKDTSKYGVEMPEELEAVLLSDFDAYEIFDSFTNGKKRGIIYEISRYKNTQTKIDKSLILCENLKRGIRENVKLLKSF